MEKYAVYSSYVYIPTFSALLKPNLTTKKSLYKVPSTPVAGGMTNQIDCDIFLKEIFLPIWSYDI